jgi:1,4-alpha-glucan branching enzyme
MSPVGAFTFVLHSHLPYARGPEQRWPHGEEWIHEAAADTYLPLLEAFDRLAERGQMGGVTLGLTPVLLEQLADADVGQRFEIYLDSREGAAREDIARFRGTDDEARVPLAEGQRDRYRHIRRLFQETYQRDIVGGFRRLVQQGVLEALTSAATHGYLPLLGRAESINLQLRTGLAATRRHLGAEPTAIWLPECAYRPAVPGADGGVRPALEEHLARLGLQLFFAETKMVEGLPVLQGATAATGPASAKGAVTFRPYHVGQSDVAVLARNRGACEQVWGSDHGYPGDAAYQEFHKREGVSGLHYWRITDNRLPLEAKEVYEPRRARARAEQQAEHFVALAADLLRAYRGSTGESGLLVATFDAELFGHWWFEGVAWLEDVLRRLAASDEVEATTASAYLARFPPSGSVVLPEGSWGEGGDHRVWMNPKTEWIWPILYQAEERMARILAAGPSESIVLQQAARELLLLQASDWPFLITTGQAPEHAAQRFNGHVERFHRLLDSQEAGRPDEALARSLWEIDKVFPDIEVAWFAP